MALGSLLSLHQACRSQQIWQIFIVPGAHSGNSSIHSGDLSILENHHLGWYVEINRLTGFERYFDILFASCGCTDLFIQLIFFFLFTEHYIGKYVEPMVWHYNPRDNFALPDGTHFFLIFKKKLRIHENIFQQIRQIYRKTNNTRL